MSDLFDPLITEWFSRRFAQPTEPQSLGWPEIRSGRDVLISAPTGSGKTLAAFLLCIDDLVRAARAGSLADHERNLRTSSEMPARMPGIAALKGHSTGRHR